MDHSSKAPAWPPGTASVGSGAGPPGLDSDDEQHDGVPGFAAGPDDSDAPGFSEVPVVGSGFGEPSPDGPGFGDVPAEAPDFDDDEDDPAGFAAAATSAYGVAPPPPGFGDAPAGSPGYDAAAAEGHGFGGAPAGTAGFGGAPAGAHPGFGTAVRPDTFGNPDAGAFAHPADPGQGFGGGQQGDYGAPYTGEFRGAYASGGFGATPDGSAPHDGPGVGTMYDGDRDYEFGRENGAGAREDFEAPYPQAEPPRSRMTASLRAFRRPRLSSKKRDRPPGRQAQLTVARIEPWSVMKFSFVISLVAFIVLFVAVAVLYAVLSGLGVFDAVQHTVSNITSSQGAAGFNVRTYVSASRVLGYAGILGAINVVLITALSTVGAVLYNITSDLAGGVEITLKETD